MAENVEDGRSSRFAWFGTVRGALTLIGTILAIVVSSFTIWKYIEERRGGPSFSGAIAQSERAKDFVSFLKKHDRKEVDLNIECVPFGPTAPDSASCAQGPEDALPFSFRQENEQLALVELFTAESCPLPEEPCPGTYWLTFRMMPADDEQVDNGRFGAGAIVARGRFRVLYRGGLGSTPENVENIELRAV